MLNVSESLIEHESKKHYNVAELGQWVHLLVMRANHRSDLEKRAKDLKDAQNYLNMMQERIDSAKLAALAESLEHVAKPAPEPESEGPPRDEGGRITRISSQPGDTGYDPEISKIEGLAIFCDGKHIETAHTADTEEGLVRYYEKNDQGRIKALEMRGKVEIRGI